MEPLGQVESDHRKPSSIINSLEAVTAGQQLKQLIARYGYPDTVVHSDDAVLRSLNGAAHFRPAAPMSSLAHITSDLQELETQLTPNHPYTVARHQQLPDVAITCTGILVIAQNAVPITAWRNCKARELLAYLATRADGCASRQEVQAALWPTAEPPEVHGLLRTALWCLRTLLDGVDTEPTTDGTRGADSIVVNAGSQLRLNLQRCWGDVLALRSMHTALLTFTPPLPGLAGTDAQVAELDSSDLASPLDARALACRWMDVAVQAACPVLVHDSFAWLPSLRRELREMCLDALDWACLSAQAAGDLHLALRAVERRLFLDLLHEPAVATALRLYLACGKTAAAMACYRAFRLALARRFSATDRTLAVPSAEVQALAATMIDTSRAQGMAASDDMRQPEAFNTGALPSSSSSSPHMRAPPSR